MIQPADILLLLPEIVLLTMACALLVIDTFSKDPERHITYLLAQTSLVITAVLAVYLNDGDSTYAFGNTFISDPMSVALKVIVCIITLVVFFIRTNI